MYIRNKWINEKNTINNTKLITIGTANAVKPECEKPHTIAIGNVMGPTKKVCISLLRAPPPAPTRR